MYDRYIAVTHDANIATCELLLRPAIMSFAILFRPMVPIIQEALPDLSTKHVSFWRISRSNSHRERNSEPFQFTKNQSRDISIHWQSRGHELTLEEIATLIFNVLSRAKSNMTIPSL
jgi:predicted esterase